MSILETIVKIFAAPEAIKAENEALSIVEVAAKIGADTFLATEGTFAVRTEAALKAFEAEVLKEGYLFAETEALVLVSAALHVIAPSQPANA